MNKLRQAWPISYCALLGWCFLVSIDLLTVYRGFPALYKFVKARRVRASFCALSALTVEDILESLRRAHVFAPRHYHCLKYWSAATCLLRLHGYPAFLVVGVKHCPFYAHAWVEYGDQTFGLPEALKDCSVLVRL